MPKEQRAISAVRQWRQFSLFPRDVVRRLTRSRHQQIEARLATEKRDRSVHGPNTGPEKEKQYETLPDPKPR